MRGLATEEGVQAGLAYRPDPTDVFISPYGKCGTTWMQQIVHGLRSGGDMDFREITEAVPWLELARDLGLDIHAPQKARPHAFKSHLDWDRIPKGGRYIVVFRDPGDALVSFYRFFEGWFFEPGGVEFAEFADFYLQSPGRRSYWEHAASWWRQRDNPDVLLLAFEHMKADLPGCVARVAGFMGGYPAERVALATAQAEFGFMKANAGKFDDNLVKRMRNRACGLPDDGAASKVSTGETGAGARMMTPDLRRALDAKWDETLGREFGLADYGALLERLRA